MWVIPKQLLKASKRNTNFSIFKEAGPTVT